ncbi:hypothetical protein EON65_51640 [archaeon]|nr:MAG: hypothetical protein EON65_51640 [archaeon]
MKSSESSGTSQNLIPHAYRKAVGAAFYGISSILVIFTNKAVMTSFRFPYVDFLATVQFVVTTIIMAVLIWLKKIDVPVLNWQITFEILPIAIMFLGNVICGLGSTNALSIPMFTALRRFSILMIMFCEWCLLNVKPSNPVMVSIGLMILGRLG